MSGRAALYIRMSTEHQDYSIVNQAAALERYAEENAMTIVKRFVDPGRSGLTLRGRSGLKNLLLDVVSAEADYDHVLVYDVSRWGRFLDADESAYYEYTCKKASIRVHYCVEPFVNDDSVYSTLIKSLKRIMAGEYSRELSCKVHAAQTRFAQMGFKNGGFAGYGLRRHVVDKDGNSKGWLGPGDVKGNKTDRVKYGPGPQHEIEMVRQIFRWFVVDRYSQTQIARMLSDRGVLAEHCKNTEWTRTRVHEVLSNPKYVGTLVFNRTSQKLGTKTVRNPPQKWVCCEGAFDAIVDAQIFANAQAVLNCHYTAMSPEKMMEGLVSLLNRKGRLSSAIIDAEPSLPSVSTITKHYGSLPAIYKLLGYTPKKDTEQTRKMQKARGNFNCLGDAIYDAVSSGKLPDTFTITALKVACPGWHNDTYAVTCALYATAGHTKQVKLNRVGRGEYHFVSHHYSSRTRFRCMDNALILERLTQLWKNKGRLSSEIISKDRDTPGISKIVRQFKSLRAVYELLGYRQVLDRASMRQRVRKRAAARESPGSMAEAIRDAVISGRLSRTFTIRELQAACPGWAYGTYFTIPRQYAVTEKAHPITLARVDRGVYRVVKLGAA